ncbi:hypothetical protein NP233_g10552 [Leucocoprinus birnbaumii]|uniref:O-methyltransferase domain-containing protein n=1 Tax=Leucocoprinus birnbaumii TaxID=56174 RepID=A0AAD5VI93_9AGAR|nr:hypothetical protein NP233_g10552 [Leucocoprinus birnbaumii]
MPKSTTNNQPHITYSMSPVPADISSLLSLITSAATSIESYYKSNPTKPYVPSLDDTEPHPLDAQVYPLDVRKAVQNLEGACAQLTATLVRPDKTVLNKHLCIYDSAYLGVALRAKIAEILLDKPQGLHVSDISEQCKIEKRKLARVLRTLCSQHVFREVAKDVFANNRLSMYFLSSTPLGAMGMHVSDEPTNKSAVELADTLLDPEWGHSDALEKSPFNRAFKTPHPMWHYFEGKDGNQKAAEQGARFGRGMAGWSAVIDADAIVTGYPWDKLPKGAVVNDVAGGWGHTSMELYKKYPNLSFILQDLPERTEQAQTEAWPTECPQAIARNKIKFRSIDLFKESPVANCDIYLIKNVIHLMPDDVATLVLSNVRKSMSPTSRVLIQETIVQYAARVPDDDVTLQQAEPPLLPNYGAGRIRQYYTDAAMMVLCNSQERTLEHYIALGNAAGLQFVTTWDLGEMSAVEYAPAT